MSEALFWTAVLIGQVILLPPAFRWAIGYGYRKGQESERRNLSL